MTLYDQSSLTQMEEWVKGNSMHNTERNECCPDFSCCHSNLLAPQETRVRFARAVTENDEWTVNNMLMMFLGEHLQEKQFILEQQDGIH